MASIASPTTKTWKSSLKAPAGLQVTETSAALVGDGTHFLAADNKGVVAYGNFSVVATAESRRVGGLWTGVNDFTNMIPSTIVSPMPMQIPFPPIYFLTSLASDLAFFMAYLG